MMGRPKLAVVRAAPIHVNPWQIQNFRHCIPFSVKFVTPPFHEAWHVNEKQHYSIRVKNLLPSFLRLKPIEHAFFISGDLNEALKDVDAIESSELFSLISYQCAKIAKRRKKKISSNRLGDHPLQPHLQPRAALLSDHQGRVKTCGYDFGHDKEGYPISVFFVCAK